MDTPLVNEDALFDKKRMAAWLQKDAQKKVLTESGKSPDAHAPVDAAISKKENK